MNQLVSLQRRELTKISSSFAPAVPHLLVTEASKSAQAVWEEFFLGQIRNRHTRIAYGRAVSRFLDWALLSNKRLNEISPGMIGYYFDTLNLSIPTKKLELAALRGFFGALVNRHVLKLNPAATVRGERYSVVEGKTAEISVNQARSLLASIDTKTVIGLRDRAVISCLIFTAARAGAVAKLRRKDFVCDGPRCSLRFEEKGGKAREIAVSSKLQTAIMEYLKVADENGQSSPELPLFRSIQGRKEVLTTAGIAGSDICRIVKRRIQQAGLSARLSPHSFRVLAITNLLLNGKSIESVQNLAGHADIRTTKLYDRRPNGITRDLVESISV